MVQRWVPGSHFGCRVSRTMYMGHIFRSWQAKAAA